jgi:peptide/nickel transport system ATP-binding protein
MTSDDVNALELRHLRVETSSGTPVVDDVSLTIRKGEILALVGESGSGKTTTALSIFGHAGAGLHLVGGAIAVAGHELSDPMSFRRARGRLAAYVPQNPGTALNPSLRILAAIRDAIHDDTDPALPSQLLKRVGLPADRPFGRRFPHQLSGGQQQRVCIATSIASSPALVVLDEPTTGLDVITQDRILKELLRLREEEGVAMLYITHDLAVAAQIADEIAVMYGGEIVETGRAAEVLSRPRHPYTLGLLASTPDHALPRERAVMAAMPGRQVPDLEPEPFLLEVRDLRAEHRGRRGTVVAADGISFGVTRGSCLALVGESGSGKTTIARVIAGLHPLAAGSVLLDGAVLPEQARKRSRDQRRRIQIVFQNPAEALNPQHSVEDTIARPAQMLLGMGATERKAEVLRLLEAVRLPASVCRRYPRELSGGERQRVAIARALAAHPDLLVCDEVTSALDVSVQAVVLELLGELRAEMGLSMLFITHDLGVVAAAADEVLVLDRGLICERGDTSTVLSDPESPYTRSLLAAAPSLSASIGAWA